jgi:hypothetical protein
MICIIEKISIAKENKLRPYFKLICDCGKSFTARADDVKRNKVNSCGCRRGVKPFSERKVIHKKLYFVHGMIKQRCNNSNHKQYKDWGGRGISYCKEWELFLNFYNWAMSNGYEEGLQIDRINNDGNYEPNNCRWVTSKVNMNNRRCSTTKEVVKS